ncbi:MAG: Nif3-like dinuclear metal center hexameric protein [Paenibacillaceae bacterium]
MTITIRDVLNILIEPVEPVEPVEPLQPLESLHNRADTLKFGTPDTAVKGIVVTFMATIHVIEQAISLGANLIITHEGTFYSHHDVFERSLDQDTIYQAKKRLIEESGMAIYRCHDDIHKYRPDGITEGLVDILGWQAYVTEQLDAATLISLPETMTGVQIVEHVKKQLSISYLRTAGNLSLALNRIGLLAGYRGGGSLSIPLFEQNQLDLIIYGEGPEWETPEYVRDAAYLGKQKSLIVLGHAESEQPGMKLLAERLDHRLPGIPVYFIPVEPIFQIT